MLHISLLFVLWLRSSLAFVVPQRSFARPRVAIVQKQSFNDDLDADDDEDDDDIDLSDQDWRAFRAKLVLGEPESKSTNKSGISTAEDGDLDGIGSLFADDEISTLGNSKLMGMTPLDPSQWAYDSGKVIEQGAVILGGVEQEYGFGLRQQYFHKAAILVLDHEENTFTKGIILNRPTDLTLEDDINPGVKWRVWFGGDVQGLNSYNPDIVCLHSMKDARVTKASIPVMKDIQWTTFENAKKLVKAGAANPQDFWVFCGYAGWGPGQLMGELDRKSWYMVATDSQTLLKELARLAAGADPRDAGLDTWTLLMNMIGRGETAEEYSGEFDDLMLKEWALKNLLSTEAGGGAGDKKRAPEGIASTQELLKSNPVDRLLSRVSAANRGEDVTSGTLVRASSAERSPFLLENQEYHKSVVLVISEDDSVTVGVILNRPAAKGLDIQITDQKSGQSRVVTLPLRYGGQYAVKGSEPLLWLHYNAVLRAAKIGSPVGIQENGFWKCTTSDATVAIGNGLASPSDFLVVTGVSVWTKGERGVARGMQGEVREGRFEIVPPSQLESVWDELSRQEVLTSSNLMKNLAHANASWSAGQLNGKKQKQGKEEGPEPIRGLGEGFDEDDETYVYKSDVKVSKLSDDSLRSWIATFLLGAPSLGG